MIAKLEATPGRPPAKTNTKVAQPRRLDRRLSAATIAELAAAYEAGTSTPEMCKRYGLSKGGVLKLLREAGVEMRKQAMTDEQIELAVRLHQRGLGYAEIGRRIGKAKSTVRAAVTGASPGPDRSREA